jgi:hypothetical protein
VNTGRKTKARAKSVKEAVFVSMEEPVPTVKNARVEASANTKNGKIVARTVPIYTGDINTVNITL